MLIDLKELLQKNKIVPVAVFNEPDDALRVVDLLLKHAFSVIEVTLRTEEAYDCIEAISKKFPEISVGAGSVLSIGALGQAYDCGARFGVSPAFDKEVVAQAKSLSLPFVPGIATPSELNEALQETPFVKVFPATALGGVNYIKAMIAPYKMKELYIMPTGGINGDNVGDFLAIDEVIACGMSYMIDKKLLFNKDFDAIEMRIRVIAGKR